jgi:hypothetical protein
MSGVAHDASAVISFAPTPVGMMAPVQASPGGMYRLKSSTSAPLMLSTKRTRTAFVSLLVLVSDT